MRDRIRPSPGSLVPHLLLGWTVDLDRPVALSWDEPAGWPAALVGIDAIYLVRPDRRDAPELVASLLAVTDEATRVVLLSEQDADRTGSGGWAPRVERAVRDSGRAWTILRPSWFMQVFSDERYYPDLLTRGGELAFPSAGERVAWIDARDIAAVAEHALLDAAHDGQVHEITGPEALTLARTVELLSVGGQPIVHRDVSVDEAVRDEQGFQRELDTVTFERVRGGSFATVTGTVEQVTGRPPRSLPAFVRERRAG